MTRVRPRGWNALVIFTIAIDFLQIVVGFTMFAIPGIGIIIGAGINIILSIFVQSFLFIWGGHNNLPSQFEHRFFTRVLMMIGEWLPFLQWMPFWTLYALTYRVEEEQIPPTEEP